MPDDKDWGIPDADRLDRIEQALGVLYWLASVDNDVAKTENQVIEAFLATAVSQLDEPPSTYTLTHLRSRAEVAIEKVDDLPQVLDPLVDGDTEFIDAFLDAAHALVEADSTRAPQEVVALHQVIANWKALAEERSRREGRL